MLHIVHHADYRAPRPERGTFVFDKYQLVMEAIAQISGDYIVYPPDQIERQWIDAVHDPAYVSQVQSATVPPEIERRIGFPVTGDIARRVRYTSGGTWAAAQLAIEHGYAANSAGGSHHALAASGAGFCVFNDLAVAANRLIHERDAARIMIIDLDVHQGDGTASLLAGRTDIFTLSVHAEKNFPVRKARSNLDIALPDQTDDDAYMAVLQHHLPKALATFSPDMILYQAGVDPHAEDKLGRLALSDKGLERRDRYVVGLARRQGIPIASALGGGYGKDQNAVAFRHAWSMVHMADEASKI